MRCRLDRSQPRLCEARENFSHGRPYREREGGEREKGKRRRGKRNQRRKGKKASSRQELPVSLEHTTLKRYSASGSPSTRSTWPYGHRLTKVDDPICGVASCRSLLPTSLSPLSLSPRPEIRLICVPCTRRPIDFGSSPPPPVIYSGFIRGNRIKGSSLFSVSCLSSTIWFRGTHPVYMHI